MLYFKNTRLTDEKQSVIIHLAGNEALLNGETNSVLTLKYPQIRFNCEEQQQISKSGKISSLFILTRDHDTFIFTIFLQGNDPDMPSKRSNGRIQQTDFFKALGAIKRQLRFLQLDKCPIAIVESLSLNSSNTQLLMSSFRHTFTNFTVNSYYRA